MPISAAHFELDQHDQSTDQKHTALAIAPSNLYAQFTGGRGGLLGSGMYVAPLSTRFCSVSAL